MKTCCVRLWIKQRLSMVGLLILALTLPGCEGGGHSWDDYDFGANDRNVCVALGDSITAGSCLDSYAECYIPKLAAMAQKTIINKAVAGSETSMGVDLVHPVLDNYRPGFLLILYGVNDLIMGYGETEALNNLRTIVQAAKDNKTAPIIATLTPVTGSHIGLVNSIERFNAGIRQMAAEEDIYVVDLEEAMNWDTAYLLPDGLHPNPAGNDVMAAAFYDTIK